MLSVLVTIIFWLAIATLGFGVARRSALWRQGATASVAWTDIFKALLKIPRRYFVDLHHVVAREPFMA